MKTNNFHLDKFSVPQNNPLLIGMQVYRATEKEIHTNDLIKRIQKKRKNIGNVADEARILRAAGMLIGLGQLAYYKGYVYRQ